MSDILDISSLEGFIWDRANAQKNWDSHGVAFHECEEIFFQHPLILPDPEHSEKERRYFAMGSTLRGRILSIVFTICENKIRVISARDMSRRERREYGKVQKNPKV